MTSKRRGKRAGALMQSASGLYTIGLEVIGEGVGIETEDAFHSANAVLRIVLEKYLHYVCLAWHKDRDKSGPQSEHPTLIVSYGLHISIPLPYKFIESWGLTKKVVTKMNAQILAQMKDLRELSFIRSGWQAYRLHMVEVVSFELHARKKPNTLESILVGLIGKQEYGWWSNGPHKDGSYGQHQVSICKFLNLGIEAFWADYAKPFAESELKWTFPSYWSTRPTDADLPSKEQLLHAVELGKLRYELAMSKPLPDKWCGIYETPTDALLARFPDNILGGQMGYLSPFFWSENPSGGTRYFGGEGIIRFAWDRIGFGTQGKKHEYIARHPAGDRKEKVPFSWATVKIHIPTPQELFDWIEAGGTPKSYIENEMDKIWI